MPPSHLSTSMSLPFLRPMGLPNPSTIQRFFRIARISTATASSSPSSSSLTPSQSSTPSSFLSNATNSTPSSHIYTQSRPYRILLTPSRNLPIYLLRKRGGNLLQTKLRKIEGDIKALRADLQAALGVDEKDVVVNHLTRQIIVKGHRKPEITKFLEERQV